MRNIRVAFALVCLTGGFLSLSVVASPEAGAANTLCIVGHSDTAYTGHNSEVVVISGTAHYVPEVQWLFASSIAKDFDQTGNASVYGFSGDLIGQMDFNKTTLVGYNGAIWATYTC